MNRAPADYDTVFTSDHENSEQLPFGHSASDMAASRPHLYIPPTPAPPPGPSPEDEELSEKTGMVLKQVSKDWKDRYLYLRPEYRALYYYETLGKFQKKERATGIYPLMGAAITEVRRSDSQFGFGIRLCSGQFVSFKMIKKEEAEDWRNSIRAVINKKIKPQQREKRAECQFIEMFTDPKRSILLSPVNNSLWVYKKPGDLTALETISLLEAKIVPKKSYGVSYEISVEPRTDAKRRLKFESPKEWSEWGDALQSVVRRVN